MNDKTDEIQEPVSYLLTKPESLVASCTMLLFMGLLLGVGVGTIVGRLVLPNFPLSDRNIIGITGMAGATIGAVMANRKARKELR